MAAIDPLKKTDRNLQVKSEKGDVRASITLLDVDYAIMTYLEDVVLPKVEQNDQSLKIPVVYGNSERWTGARKQGVYRDLNGKIQLPMIMIRRSSVAKNESIPMLNRQVTYRAVTKYSKQNKYERFSLLNPKPNPSYDVYEITMPDYVEVTYECMGWTNFTEHLNAVVEALTFASDEYWGDKQKFKFITTITDYTITNDVTEGAERVNRVEFSLNVKAYLLPEKYDGQSTIRKGTNIKTIASNIVTSEKDLTANGRLEQVLSSSSPYYDNKDLIDFLSLNNTKSGNPITNNTISFTDTKLVKIPASFLTVISSTLTIGTDAYDIRVYINGVRVLQANNFTAIFSPSSNLLTLTFDATYLGYNVTSADEVTITGRFIDL